MSRCGTSRDALWSSVSPTAPETVPSVRSWEHHTLPSSPKLPFETPGAPPTPTWTPPVKRPHQPVVGIGPTPHPVSPHPVSPHLVYTSNATSHTLPGPGPESRRERDLCVADKSPQGTNQLPHQPQFWVLGRPGLPTPPYAIPATDSPGRTLASSRRKWAPLQSPPTTQVPSRAYLSK